MSLTNVQFELDAASLATLDEIAENMEADRATVLRDAIAFYLADYEQEKVQVEEAERQLDAGLGIPHAEVVARLNTRLALSPTAKAA